MKLVSVRVTNYKSFADTQEVKLGQINILVGRNNSGKSAFIHAIHLLQEGAEYDPRDIRFGAAEYDINYVLADVNDVVGRRVGPIEVGVSVGQEFRANVVRRLPT